MALLKPYRKFNHELPRVNAFPFVFSSSTPAATFREAVWVEAKAQGKVEMKERKDFRFVRVNDRLFKVPEGFFMQMTLKTQYGIKFSAGQGLTPERPIFLQGHTEEQFKQILSAYNAFPSLDANSFTLDHLLTIGELSIEYGLRDLIQWFSSAFRELILGPHTPLHTIPNYFFLRMMKLALQMKSVELTGVIQASWANRIHSKELSPIWALLFADMHGLRDLLGHACYGYLMSVVGKIERGQNFNEAKLLKPRQAVYIQAGYHSLRACWELSGRHPPEFEGDAGCALHSQCVRVWKQRWSTLLEGLEGQFPVVDVLNKLGLMLQLVKDDGIVAICLTSSCRTAGLKALMRKRDRLTHQLHHHFDI